MRAPAAHVLQYATRNHHHLGYSLEEGRGPHTDAVTPIIGGIQRVGRRLLSERHAAYLRISCGRFGTPFLLFSCEPDQKRFIGHVPCPCDYDGRRCQRPFALAPTFPPFLSLWKSGRGWGEGEGRQACAAAPALKPSRRRKLCPPAFLETLRTMVEPQQKPRFLIML